MHFRFPLRASAAPKRLGPALLTCAALVACQATPATPEAPRAEYPIAEKELAELYAEDQAEHASVLAQMPADEVALRALVERDAARVERVLDMHRMGLLRTAEQRCQAAQILLCGSSAEHFDLAHQLARSAAEAGHRPARWLAAASLDRSRMERGLPQKYGTQYVWFESGWVLYRVDPATSDAERAEWDVPSLSRARAQASARNASLRR